MKRKMKRRLCSLLLAFALLPAVAPAEVVGRDGMYADRYIHRIEAPNGQALYYLSTEEDAFVTARDVNFDGVDDLVVFSARGASNAWVLFFVWDGNAYVRATWDAGEDTGPAQLRASARRRAPAGQLRRRPGRRASPLLAVPVGGDGPAPCAQRGERDRSGNGD